MALHLRPLHFIIGLSLVWTNLSFAQNSAANGSHSLEELLKKHATTSQYCQFQVLKKLGWSVEEGEGMPGQSSSLETIPGKPCDRQDLSEAKEMGDLKLIYNQKKDGFDEKDFKNSSLPNIVKKIDQTLKNKDSLCSYKFKVGQAVAAASQKLTNSIVNGLYTFGTTETHFCHAEGDEWDSIGSPFSACMIAKFSPKAAMDCFYNKKCYSECAVGLQVGQLATLSELYGDDFDKAFKANEIAVGTWNSVMHTRNPYWRDYAKKVQDPKAHHITSLGLQAYVGQSGIIWNKYGESYLDSANDRGENYVIVSVSKEAAEQLKRDGGLEKMDEKNMLLWQLNLSLKSAKEDNNEEEIRSIEEDMNKILTSPVYADIQVYVHPLGIQSFGHHVSRLLDINPRTPYVFQFYEDGANDTLFTKYTDYEVKKCENELSHSVVK